MADADKTLSLKIELDGYVMPGTKQVKEELAQANAQVAKEMGAITVSSEEADKILKQTANDGKKGAEDEQDATEKLKLGKRELLESMRELTRQYPVLGEAARAVFNPLTVASFGVAESINIWIKRLQTAQELLGGWQLPDFTEHTAGVSAAAAAYDQLKTAVSGADVEFEGAASAFERQSKAISAQLEATKQLIAAQKEKAVADLDIQRATGQISTGMYEARKQMIEQGANDATVKAENDARTADLNAKKQEAAGLGQQSTAEAAKAAAIQPGRNDAAMQQLIDEAKAAADTAGKKAAEFRAEADHAKEVAGRAEGGQGLPGLSDVLHNAPGDLAWAAKYGLTADPNTVAQMNQDAAKQAETQQAALEENAKQLQKQLDDRKKHNDEAARLAAESETKRRELQGEDDPNKPGSVAWQNAQATKTQGVRDSAAESSQFAKDVEAFARDNAQYTAAASKPDPQNVAKARQAMADMAGLVNDALGIISDLAAHHQSVADLRRKVEDMEHTLESHGAQISNGRMNFAG